MPKPPCAAAEKKKEEEEEEERRRRAKLSGYPPHAAGGRRRGMGGRAGFTWVNVCDGNDHGFADATEAAAFCYIASFVQKMLLELEKLREKHVN